MCVCLGYAEKKHFEVYGPEKKHNKKFNITGYEYQLELRDLQSAPDVAEVVKEAFAEVLSRTFKGGDNNPQDDAAVEVDHPALDHPIHIGFCSEEKITADKIMRAIEKVQQSKKELKTDENLTVMITRVRYRKGGKLGEG